MALSWRGTETYVNVAEAGLYQTKTCQILADKLQPLIALLLIFLIICEEWFLGNGNVQWFVDKYLKLLPVWLGICGELG